jgi:hypothetical protein
MSGVRDANGNPCNIAVVTPAGSGVAFGVRASQRVASPAARRSLP